MPGQMEQNYSSLPWLDPRRERERGHEVSSAEFLGYVCEFMATCW